LSNVHFLIKLKAIGSLVVIKTEKTFKSKNKTPNYIRPFNCTRR